MINFLVVLCVLINLGAVLVLGSARTKLWAKYLIMRDTLEVVNSVNTELKKINEERISENIQQKTQAYERKSHTKP